MEEDKNKLKYFEELKKAIGKEVTVQKFKPDGKIDEVKGILRGINFQHLSVVIMTDEEKIIIKHFDYIRRKRSKR